MTADQPPSLTLLGAYSFSADNAAYARFIRELIDSHDPPNFSEEVNALLRKAGRGDEIVPLTGEDLTGGNWKTIYEVTWMTL